MNLPHVVNQMMKYKIFTEDFQFTPSFQNILEYHIKKRNIMTFKELVQNGPLLCGLIFEARKTKDDPSVYHTVARLPENELDEILPMAQILGQYLMDMEKGVHQDDCYN